jgi:hypothetical protein
MENSSSSLRKNYSIVISCYSRANLLETCLRSITSAEKFELFNLIVVHQLGHQTVSEVLEKYKDKIDFKLEINSQLPTPLANINWNRMVSYELAFESLNSEFALGIEEDVEISSDALSFAIWAHQNYKHRRDYRGVNLGSIAKNGDSSNFNLLRYGLHGQAGTITETTWKSLPHILVKKRLLNHPLDGMFESYLKTGFMVTPVRSKYVDRGWGGTHAPSDPSHEHYANVLESFMNTSSLIYLESADKPTPSWRIDCNIYRKRLNVIYRLLHLLNLAALSFKKPILFKLSAKIESYLAVKD